MKDTKGKTQNGAWAVDKDITGERVVLSLFQGEGAEARLTLEEADRLGRALVDAAESIKQRLSTT